MEFLNWLEANLLGVVALVGAVASPIVTLFQIWRTSKVQMRQIRPEVVQHRCRVCNLDIYTYFDENNKTSEPACVYLTLDNSRICRFDPQSFPDEQAQEKASSMLKVNNGKCYLSLWGSKLSGA